MARTNQDASFYANNDFVLAYTLYDDDADPVVLLDVSGATIKWVISHKVSAGNPGKIPMLAKSTVTGGIVITDGPNGEVEVTVADTDTEFLKGNYYMELELTDTSGNKTVQSTGILTLLKNVTNV